MPSFGSFLLVSLIGYALAYGVVRLAMASKGFRARPIEEQAQVRKTYKLALIVMPPAIVGSYFLRTASPSVMKWVPLVLYVLLWLLAICVLWIAYSLAVYKEHGFVGSRIAKQKCNSHALVRALVWLNLFLALALIALLVAIPTLKLGLSSWPVLITILSACYAMALQRIQRKSDA